MRKNTTLLLKKYQIGPRIGRPIFHYIAPLFELKMYRINLTSTLAQITNNQKITYTPLKLQQNNQTKNKPKIDRIVAVHSGHESNARRNVFINEHRNQIIHYLNQEGQKSTMYTLTLSEINDYIPANCLIQQLKEALKNHKIQTNSPKAEDLSLKRLQILRQNVLFPFQSNLWQKILKSELLRAKTKNFQTFKETFLYIQLCNIYKLKYSSNPDYFYLDLCDFDKMLQKFNFIRYFWQTTSSNQFLALKYSERLIKSIQWRTKETESYLLLMLRSFSWSKFLILIKSSIDAYKQHSSIEFNN